MTHSLKIAGLLAATVLTVFLVSRCGGGGGGDSAPVVQPIAYTGNTEAAVVTLENTPTLVANVLFGGAAGEDVPLAVSMTEATTASTRLKSFIEVPLAIYHFSLDNLIGDATHGFRMPASAVVDDTVQCESGFYTAQGTIDDITGTGTLTFIFHDCLDDGITMDGTVLFHVHYDDFFHFNATMEMVLLRVYGTEYDVSMSGTIGIDELLSNNAYTETTTNNYVRQNNRSGKMYMYENYVMTAHIDDLFSPSSGGYISYTGIPAAVIYDSVHGSLRIDTIDPLLFSSVLLTYPDEGGKLVFTGNNSGIQLSVQSVRHVKLELDVDGATGYEVERYALWTELEDVNSLNLSDTDGDGMHDSWETRFGLDAVADDSAGDLDGDGLTNLQEYQQGYDPGNPLSPLT